MRRRKAGTTTDTTDRDLLEHVRSLNLATVEEYRQWCAENGFSRKLQKHWKLRGREREFVRRSIACDRLSQRKREVRNTVEVLSAICLGRLQRNDVSLPHLQRFCEALDGPAARTKVRPVDRAALSRLLSHTSSRRAAFFDGSAAIPSFGTVPGNTYVEAMAMMAAYHVAWLRPLELWRPRSHSACRQFGSLLRHLFVRHNDMPAFFDAVWFTGTAAAEAERRDWYVHVGRGDNIRHCRLPLPYTKKMAHWFLRAPCDVTVDQALRWGQVLGLGGDERLARAIFGTRLMNGFENNDFWLTVIEWFIKHPLLDRACVGPLIDYLHHQRFVPEALFAGDGRISAQPLQPRLTMKGRSPETLLRHVQAWHRKLARDNTQQLQQWQPCGIEPFEFFEGLREHGTLKCWTIRELLSNQSLLAEGRLMRHCVASYASSCLRGHCAIWTMDVESSAGREKALTIEVRTAGRQICQARGKANRLPTEKERGILRRWATAAGLKVASFV